MIAIIDYKMGNVGSIVNMLRTFTADIILTNESEVIEKAQKLILPGVGAFDSGMTNLERLHIIDILNKKVLTDKIPILGVCLGMQLFCQRSEEGGNQGLGWINANVIRFKFNNQVGADLRLPHMGWNCLVDKGHPSLLVGIDPELRFYFAHSYHLECKSDDIIVATAEYGYDFPAIVQQENIVGVQFHPEKSHKFGLSFLKNWVQSC